MNDHSISVRINTEVLKTLNEIAERAGVPLETVATVALARHVVLLEKGELSSNPEQSEVVEPKETEESKKGDSVSDT